jgi:hypothetical protein
VRGTVAGHYGSAKTSYNSAMPGGGTAPNLRNANFGIAQTSFAIPGQSEIIGAPQNKKARVVRAKTEEKKCSFTL